MFVLNSNSFSKFFLIFCQIFRPFLSNISSLFLPNISSFFVKYFVIFCQIFRHFLVKYFVIFLPNISSFFVKYFFIFFVKYFANFLSNILSIIFSNFSCIFYNCTQKYQLMNCFPLILPEGRFFWQGGNFFSVFF